MGSSRPRNSTRAAKARSVNSSSRRTPALSPETAKRKEERALREGIKRFLAADRLPRDAVHERPKPTRLRTGADVLRDVERVRGTKAAKQLSISPTQVLREMRDGAPITELREIHDRLDVALSVVSLCAAVLQVQMADYDADVAASLKHCVGDILDTQMERITTLIKGDAA